MSVVIGTDCLGSCKSNYHMIMTVPCIVSSKNFDYICIDIYEKCNVDLQVFTISSEGLK